MAAAVDPTQLPEGFTLEADPTALPEGYTLEAAPAAPSSGLVHDIYTGAANIASKVPYLPEAANAVGTAANRIGANLPFADRATAGASALLGNGDYNSNLAGIRAYDANRWKEHPYQEVGASVAGSALPVIGAVGKAAEAAKLIPSMFRGGAMGLGWGAAQGVSDIPDYSDVSGTDLGNVVKSAGIGTAAGAALPAIGKAVGATYRGITNAPYRTVAGMEQPAQQKFIDALNFDNPARVKTDLGGLGSEGMPLDASPSIQNIMLGIAREAASPAKTQLMRELGTRNAGAYDRTSAALDANMGQAQSPGQFLEGIKAKLDAAGDGPMNTAIAARDSGIKVDTTDIRSNLGTALSNAEGDIKATKALNTVKNGLQRQVMDPQGKPIAGLAQPVDNPLILHNVKKSFDDLIDHGDPALGIGGGELQRRNPIMTFRSQLNGALRDTIPGYADANDQISSLLRQRDQFNLGQSVLSNSKKEITNPEDFSRVFNALPPEEQAARTAGTRADLDATLGVKGNNPNVRNPSGPLINAFNGEGGWNQQNLGTQFGQQPVSNVMNTLNAEKTMGDPYNRLYNGSITSSAESAKAANKEPWQIPQVPRGLIAGPLNTLRGIGNAAIGAFRSGLPPDTTARDLQMVTGATQRGPAAQAIIDALMGANAKRTGNAATSDALVRALMGGLAEGTQGVSAARAHANQ